MNIGEMVKMRWKWENEKVRRERGGRRREDKDGKWRRVEED